MMMASDWLGIAAADYGDKGEHLPVVSYLNDLSLEENNPFKDDDDFDFKYDKKKSFVSLVTADLTDYVEQGRLVKKTLSIPMWADKAAKKNRINFSQTLTEAIIEKLA
jgi:hypothetical protein